MQHADGRWIWLRVRCELATPGRRAGLHLIGIAVDITEQKSLAERTIEADLRLRDAIETIPEAFVLWDADNRLVLCNSNFQALHNLPDEAVHAGHAVRDGQRGRPHAGCAHPAVADDERASRRGARTFEAQLDDGRWLHISERRTKDGGYVSVGTDITNIKQHEQKLVENELRLHRHRRRPAPLAAGAGASGRANSPISPRNTPRKRPAPRKPTRPSRNSSPI